jgi:hypothetical protein
MRARRAQQQGQEQPEQEEREEVEESVAIGTYDYLTSLSMRVSLG